MGRSLCRGIPDGRRVGALLEGRRHLRRELHAVVLGIVGRPSRRRYLKYAAIVKSPLLRIEIRVFPDSDQLRGANCISPVGVCDVDGVADGGQLAIWTWPAPARPHNVVNLLLH